MISDTMSRKKDICDVCVLGDGICGARLVETERGKICTKCLEFEKWRKYLDNRFEDFMRFLKEIPVGESEFDALVALSGGKDSTLALVLAYSIGLRILAVTIDHGFLAPIALENSLMMCSKLGVPLMIYKRDYSDLFRSKIARGESPCRDCSRRNIRALVRIAKSLGIPIIITGHEIPQGGRVVERRGEITILRLPALLMLDERRIREFLERLGWRDPHLGGYTTNCLILPIAVERFYKKRGYSFEADRIAHLVRLGILDRERALKLVYEPPDVSEEVREMVTRRLNLEPSQHI